MRSDASPLLDELWVRGRDDSSSELSAYGLKVAVPSESITVVERWCDHQTPEDVRDRAHIAADVAGNKITIYECTRLPDGQRWLRVPSAQLRYDERTRVWALYWTDVNDRWHIVQATPTLDVRDLLAVIEADPDCLFFG